MTPGRTQGGAGGGFSAGPGPVFVSALSRVQRQLAHWVVLLTEPEKAGSPGRSARGAHSVIGSWAAFNVTRGL